MQFQKVFYPCGELFIPSFYRIPRPLFFHEELMKLSNNAKLLYALMLDRLNLSISNSWFDESGQIYVYFTVHEICAYLNCSRNTALGLLSELDSRGLISRIKQGLCKPDRIYVRLLSDMESYPPKCS